ncbi:phosphatidate phosphatase APP1 [Isoptericola jiangsuensis]|uniref:Phosphatidate phosphatase APP1 n=1 Tax=Isoptericola jiangsuensis TaxID=548579 RepID=A0A2A9EQK5_9MICO|nr:phosphatase domain-containing protein [Isoptericola jiangsuensis]PFG41377.1 phosphatidate phosphatase APP1 [Isoptericola jiangsuensis]
MTTSPDGARTDRGAGQTAGRGAVATPHPTQRPHLAAVVEDAFYDVLGGVLRRLGWRPRVQPFTGYGSPDRVRVLARVLLSPPQAARRDERRAARRGFRHFLTVPAPQTDVRLHVGGRTYAVVTDRSGYVDVEIDLDAPLGPGWQDVTIEPRDPVRDVVGERAVAPLLVLAPAARFGVISDVDDTTLVTAVPRPLLATWNTFVRHGTARRAVPGMPVLYRRLRDEHADAVVVYLSNGAWNIAGALRAFLSRNEYPAGPLLLTDWGPTLTGWFRSGPAHKASSIDLLMSRFPDVRWLLVGDDGQHDPEIYARAVERWPGRVRAVAIRQVGGGRPVAPDQLDGLLADDVPVVRAPDGAGLCEQLAQVPGIFDGPATR